MGDFCEKSVSSVLRLKNNRGPDIGKAYKLNHFSILNFIGIDRCFCKNLNQCIIFNKLMKNKGKDFVNFFVFLLSSFTLNIKKIETLSMYNVSLTLTAKTSTKTIDDVSI